jgi:hypothetical protein
MEEPYQGRAIVQDNLGTVRIVVPVRQSKSASLFIGFWLVAWTFGEINALRSLMNDWRNGHLGSIFLIAWLSIWTIGGISAIRMLLWSMLGKEIITIGQGILTLSATGDLFAKAKLYALQDIRNLRVQDPVYGEAEVKSRFNPTSPKGIGTIRFDYGLQTVNFASGIDEAEANYLLALLRKKRLLNDKNFTMSFEH